MEIFQRIWGLLVNYKEIVMIGAMIVTLIIGIIGAIKPLLFNRIKNAELRRFALSISNTIGSFTSTAVYFAVKQMDWSKYVIASVILSICCVLVYHLYETIPYLRLGIDKAFQKMLGHLYDIGVLVTKGAPKAQIKAQLLEMTNDFKQAAKVQIKSASTSLKKDKELENL